MIFSVLLIIVCALLILVVLMQNSKGGGISSQFSAANQIMGIRRGADFIEKATWTLAILLLVFSLLMTPKAGTTSESGPTESVTRKKAANAVIPQQGPAQPQQAPAQDAQPQGGEQHGPNDGHNH
jgi:preprotein translocase subunit SecG